MRLRNVKGAAKILENNQDLVILEPKLYRSKWHEFFGNQNPIHIEVGMGKGQFVYEMALKYPDINFIGIEKYDNVIVRAVEKLREQKPSNLMLIRMDAEKLLDSFADGEISRIYLSFSDPWPKNRHAKRRLTHSNFLKLYEQILNKEGELHFKTDNRLLFEFSLVSVSLYGMLLKNVWLDLHDDPDFDSVMTEYEEKFATMGKRIYRLEASFKR
ncbi:tRNA (guanosine(46)-N7)-methyltransferase TrmB [Haloplasma contractile]|uniref:tRNA (guanine-N(7)-)-methyltransferase n=1 Tax=Haloplasma contractile SSD-17B TaxID=1033810 RepID=U2FRM8_9MOLU|nr:tRNA (guanosine(46)-N7)-methyltransferase TrmB [Haloplasma contractile]ERJ13619.1 tRNA -methyltransferase protein [Haloplasma contractile SSD-17B]